MRLDKGCHLGYIPGMNKNEITPVQIAIRIVIIIIVLAILLMVSFAMVRFVPKVLSSLSGFRSIFGAKERLALSLDKAEITQNGDAMLTIKQNRGVTDGRYEISFSCSKIDSSTNLKVSRGDERDTIQCGDDFILADSPSTSVPAEVSIQHVGDPVSYDQPILITVAHVNATSTLSSDSATLTVLKNKETSKTPVAATTTAPTTLTGTTIIPKATSTPPVKTNPVPKTYSSAPAQLTANLKSVSVDSNNRATVTFYVTNVGGRNSGSWAFSAYLPRRGQTSYQSAYQSSIPPQGSSIMYLTFDDAQAGTIVINVQNSQVSAVLK